MHYVDNIIPILYSIVLFLLLVNTYVNGDQTAKIINIFKIIKNSVNYKHFVFVAQSNIGIIL